MAAIDTIKAPNTVSARPAVSSQDECIRQTYRRMVRKRCQIVGSGGVFTPEDAYRKIKLGASLVQILASLVYEGPGVVRSLTSGIVALLRRRIFIGSRSCRM